MPSSLSMRKTFFKSLDLDFTGKNVVDLGSGWGHLVVGMAKKYPGSRVTGYENSLLPFLFAFFLKGKLSLRLLWQDFFKADLTEQDVVLCYLCPYSMKKLAPKFLKELKEGSTIISLVFALPGWKASRVVYANDLYKSPIYFYEKNGQT